MPQFSPHESVVLCYLATQCEKTAEYATQQGLVAPGSIDIEALAEALADTTIARRVGVMVRTGAGESSTTHVEIPPQNGLSDDAYSNLISAAMDFDDEYHRGWYSAHRKFQNEKYELEVRRFISRNQELKLQVGDVVFIQSKGDPSKWLTGPITYLSPQMHVIAIELQDGIHRERPMIFVFGEFESLFDVYREKPQNL